MQIKINDVRRFLMRSLTSNIGHVLTDKDILLLKTIPLERILIVRPNSRLGNQLLLTPLIQEIINHFPECKIDIFVRGNLAPILFENYSNVDRIIKLPSKPFKDLISYVKTWLSLRKYRYDLVLNVDVKSSSGRLSTRIAKSKIKFYSHNDPELFIQNSDYNHMAKRSVYNFRDYLVKAGHTLTNKQIPFLSLKLSNTELTNGAVILKEITQSDKPTICIYTFATGDKCYSESWWINVYDRLKAMYDEKYTILEVLPKENVSQIGFSALTYYSMNIREMGAVIANCSIFISADCGIMHLASSVGVPTIGLFSVTNMEQYAPYNYGSIAVDTPKTNIEELINQIDKALKTNLSQFITLFFFNLLFQF